MEARIGYERLVGAAEEPWRICLPPYAVGTYLRHSVCIVSCAAGELSHHHRMTAVALDQ